MRRFVGVILFSFGLSTCGSETTRQIATGEPSVGVENPDLGGDATALKISFIHSIDEKSVVTPQIFISLKNSSDSTGQSISDIVGTEFIVKISDRSFKLKLNADQTQYDLTSVISINDQDYIKLHNQEISLTAINGTSLSADRAKTAPLISDDLLNYPLLEDRLIKACDMRKPWKIAWRATTQGSMQIEISQSSSIKFSSTVADISFWQVNIKLFQTFFDQSEIDAANTEMFGFYGYTDSKPVNFKLTRQLPIQGIRIGKTITRTLAIQSTIQETSSFQIQYNGGCAL